MSEGFNQWIGVGNLGSDSELKMSRGGTAILQFRMACTERVKGKDGQWEDSTQWIPVVIFGARADGLSKILTKGARVTVVGRLQYRSYEDRDGNKRTVSEVVAREVILGGSRQGGSRQDESDPAPPRETQRRPQRQAPPPADDDGPPPDLPEDDLPF